MTSKDYLSLCKIGITAIAAAAAGLHAEQRARGAFKTFNLVLCPSHITEKWVREIHETLPNTFAAVIHNIKELNVLHGLYSQGTRSCYAILSKEQARDGYMHAPAVVWNVRRQAFACPDCGATVEMNISKDGTVYRVNADQFYFRREHSENHKCEACGSLLWTALNPSVPPDKTPWIKLGDYGFIFRTQAVAHLKHAKNPAQAARISEVVQDPNAPYPARGARRAFSLSTYIKRYYKGKIDALLVDELHQYNNKSGQGEAMGDLFGAARKVVGMTATLINGYSSGIFHLLYRIVPHLMKRNGKDYEDPSKFDAEYGVIQNIYEEKEADYNSNRRTVRTKKATRQLPGVSPLVYSSFLMEYAAFLSLADMGKDLPEYEEIPVPLAMPSEVTREYDRIEAVLLRVLKEDKKAARKLLSAYLNLLTAYPDQPYSHKPIIHPIDGHELVVPADTADVDIPLPKEAALMEIVERKMKAGERVLIYTNWTRLDTQQKLMKHLSALGYRTTILPATIETRKREQWVADRVAEGTQILITNPTLIETGLDLNAFTTLVFYDVGYKLFTLRQASRRSWRINQTAPRVEVFMLYYAHTMQHKAMKLMASKLAVAGIIEGNFTEEGLAAMSECEDMMTQMARELMLGIKDNVEDVSVAFKRMAFLKPVDAPAMPTFTDAPIIIEPPTARKPALDAPKIAMVEFTFGVSAAPAAVPNHPLFVPDLLPSPGAIGTRKRSRQSQPDENQLSIFELTA